MGGVCPIDGRGPDLEQETAVVPVRSSTAQVKLPSPRGVVVVIATATTVVAASGPALAHYRVSARPGLVLPGLGGGATGVPEGEHRCLLPHVRREN